NDRAPPGRCSLDLVICGLAVGHIITPHLWGALGEMRRVLAPGGAALISDLHPVRAWQGAQRSFATDEGTFAVQHYIHSYADYHAAAARLGWSIEAVRETAPAPDQPPAVLALRLRR
ncbi:MAG: class I SAM-dependent methyltransferase, partial [Anaerolineae bacterium]|nr:class I SAM-dependent methyltransferase [Anaerolineae bacterium]